MTASQNHGTTIENLIKALFGNAANHKRLSTQPFDIENIFDSEKKLPTSIKTTKGKSIGLADARNIFSISENFRLLDIKYHQEGDIKKIYEIIEFLPTIEEWNKLKGDLPYDEVESFHHKLKEFKVGEHFRARAWAKAHKEHLEEKYQSLISLDYKIDSKNQRRLQCSVSEHILKDNIKNYTVHTTHYRTLVLPAAILSPMRERNEKTQAHQLDQFFTKPEVALMCYETLKNYMANNPVQFDTWLEPSAGAGAFLDLMPDNKIGIDISPQKPHIHAGNFLTYSLKPEKYIALGNPPFGKNSSLAIQFFNRCAMFCEMIAFIVPKTFKKLSVQSKLNDYFHLVEEVSLPEFSFELEGSDYDVPCVFQIWRNLKNPRIKIKPLKNHIDFVFVEKSHANFAIQRVGVNAGAVKKEFEHCAPPSHYFIKAPDKVREIFEKVDWSSVKYNTAGNPSISKDELILLYMQEKEKFSITKSNINKEEK